MINPRLHKNIFNRFWIPSLIQAVGGFVSGVSNYNAQKSENQKNRDFNALEAQKNRDFQQRQITEYRNYNSPINQARLMQEAGYHPMTALGQFGQMDAGLTSGSSASSSGSFSPVDYGISNTANLLQNSPLVKAQEKKIDAEADEAAANAKKIEVDRTTNELMQNDVVTLANLQVTYQKFKNEEQAQKVAVLYATMNEQIETYKQNLNNLITQGKILNSQHIAQNLENYFNSDTYEARVQQVKDQSKITHAQADAITRRVSLELALMASQLKVNDATAFATRQQGFANMTQYWLNKQQYDFNEKANPLALRSMSVSADKLQVEFDANKDWAEFNAGVDAISNAISGVIDPITQVLNVTNYFKPKTPKNKTTLTQKMGNKTFREEHYY